MSAAMCDARLSTAASDLRRNTRSIDLVGIAVGMWEQKMVGGWPVRARRCWRYIERVSLPARASPPTASWWRSRFGIPRVQAKNAAQREEPALPTHYKPRGNPAQAAQRSIIDHELEAAYHRSLAPDPVSLLVLPARKRKASHMT